MTTEALADRYCAWKQWGEGEFGTLSPDDIAYFDAEIGPLIQGRAKVLELGFGNGNFLSWCRLRGHECIGVETNERLVSAAVAHGYSAANSLDRIEGQFDMAVAFDVLEHIPEDYLAQVLAGTGALLRPDGVLVARFPNGDSPFGRLYQNGDMTHCTVLGSGKISWLAAGSGLELELCKEPAVALRGCGLMRASRRLISLTFRRLITRVICFAYYAGVRHVQSANLVVVLRRRGGARYPHLPR